MPEYFFVLSYGKPRSLYRLRGLFCTPGNSCFVIYHIYRLDMSQAFLQLCTAFRYMKNDTKAVSTSVIQKACHTPEAPKIQLSTKATGRIMTTYLEREIIRDGRPFPIPSSAPQEVTERAENINPMLMMRRATAPACTVSLLLLNIPIN